MARTDLAEVLKSSAAVKSYCEIDPEVAEENADEAIDAVRLANAGPKEGAAKYGRPDAGGRRKECRRVRLA